MVSLTALANRQPRFVKYLVFQLRLFVFRGFLFTLLGFYLEIDLLGPIFPVLLHWQNPFGKLGGKVSCFSAILAQVIQLPRAALALNEFPGTFPNDLPGPVLKEEGLCPLQLFAGKGRG